MQTHCLVFFMERPTVQSSLWKDPHSLILPAFLSVLFIHNSKADFFMAFQNGSLFYFFIEDWQFVNEFRHVVGEWYVQTQKLKIFCLVSLLLGFILIVEHFSMRLSGIVFKSSSYICIQVQLSVAGRHILVVRQTERHSQLDKYIVKQTD